MKKKDDSRDWIVQTTKELLADGHLEIARDDKGQVIRRNGQVVYRITKKGIEEALAHRFDEAEADLN